MPTPVRTDGRTALFLFGGIFLVYLSTAIGVLDFGDDWLHAVCHAVDRGVGRRRCAGLDPRLCDAGPTAGITASTVSVSLFSRYPFTSPVRKSRRPLLPHECHYQASMGLAASLGGQNGTFKLMSFFRHLRSLLPLELRIPQGLGKRALASIGYFRFRTRLAAKGVEVPDLDLYRPLFAPWEGQEEFKRYYDLVRPHTLVSPDRVWILLRFLQHARQLPGDFVECGVFRGGTALLAAESLRQADDGRALHLFDSFAGMPETSTGEAFQKGDFSRTSEAAVRALVSPTGANVVFHPG